MEHMSRDEQPSLNWFFSIRGGPCNSLSHINEGEVQSLGATE